MEGFTKKLPDPQPIRYIRKFDKKEIEKALKEYLEQKGIPVPSGTTYLWGLDEENGDDGQLTLVIDSMDDTN